MSRITLFMLPEPGHLLPTFRFATKLKQKGHHICYVSFAELRNDIEALGFDFISILDRFSYARCNDGRMLETKQSGFQVYQVLIAQVQREPTTVVKEIIRDIMQTRPDLLILDSGLLMMDGALSCFNRNSTPMSTALQKLQCALLRVSPGFTETYQSFPVSDFFRKLPELILCPKEFDLPAARPLAHEQHFVEPSVFSTRLEIPFLWEWIDNTRKLAYCSFGSQSRAYPESLLVLRHIVKVFQELPSIQLVLAIGAHRDVDALGNIPSNILIRKTVPQLDLIKRASVVITHGGMGTIKEAILSAVPLMITPFDFDQPFNTQRVIHHGIGYMMPNAPLPPIAKVKDMIMKLIHSKDIKAGITRMQSIFQKVEDSTPSISCIEAIIARNKYIMS